MQKNLFAIFLLLVGLAIQAQTPFQISLEPFSIPNAPGLQSYAAGEWQGQWVLLGGRTDGLHKRQPFAAFDEANQNDHIYVLDPATAQSWSAPVGGLPAAIAEQLLGTNLEFAQRDSILYLAGGYGYSPTAADHITHPQLLAVNMPGIIQAIRQGQNIAPYIRAVADTRMAVCGGRMALLEGRFFLVGGQRFDGRYNPMNHPTFVQEYTNEIRIFQIEDDGAALAVKNYAAWSDSAHLHRRDYNLAPQIFPDGRPGLTLFSGVFQYADDLPWLYPVDIDTSGYTPHPQFAQYLNHYHCANMSLFSDAAKTQHTIFFGGMAQYTLDSGGALIQDVNVPFVQTIARVTRQANGTLEEVKLPVDMPAYLGSGAEFFKNPDFPAYENGVLQLDHLGDAPVLAGYIYGGIQSPLPNIFFTNTPSTAISTLYKVWLSKSSSATGEQSVVNPLRMRVSPNPANGDLRIDYWLPEEATVRVRIYNDAGRLLGEFDEGERTEGVHWVKLGATGLPHGPLLINLLAGDVQVTQKVLLE